ncbi:hypothetical protein IFM89_005169 [Coptis chinensis]|uniref:MORF/ORRM1/DAG-like MORF domain-containing protein n=1 Tax=Coptis chinensis TaxID=261450 RepID=A0A835IJS3_9MAGN|nr:hypothetical protein IFM89_005169 [Coptis chinensis]
MVGIEVRKDIVLCVGECGVFSVSVVRVCVSSWCVCRSWWCACVFSYVQTLATVVGSEEEAERKIYRIECGGRLFGFGATIEEETANKLNGLPGVLNVFPENRSLKLDWEWFKREFDEE